MAGIVYILLPREWIWMNIWYSFRTRQENNLMLAQMRVYLTIKPDLKKLNASKQAQRSHWWYNYFKCFVIIMFLFCYYKDFKNFYLIVFPLSFFRVAGEMSTGWITRVRAVVNVHKKAPKNNTKNYRGITLLTTALKL